MVERTCAECGLVVQCTTPHQNFNYPPSAAEGHARHVRVDPRSERYRQPELHAAMPYIRNALPNGQDVIFHCMQSFHRAPVTAAAAYRRVTGAIATVRTCVMKPFVAATSQIKYVLVRFSSMIYIVNLICVISLICV